MPNYSEYYDTIDDIVDHIKKDFIGPIDEYEVLEIEDPLSRYSNGILWAQQQNKTSETIDPRDLEEEMFDDNMDNNEAITNINLLKPSSMGLSFSSMSGDTLEVDFSYGVYHYYTETRVEDERDKEYRFFKREPRHFSAKFVIPNYCTSFSINDEQYNDILLFVNIRRHENDGNNLITVSVLNNKIATTNYFEVNALTLFQCNLSIKNANGFKPIYKIKSNNSAQSQKNDMLYDSIINYSYGHGCACEHIENNGIVNEIHSEFIPRYTMLQMMPRLIEDSDYLYMTYWETIDRETACEALLNFIKHYEHWYSALQQNNNIIKRYPKAAENSFNNIEVCIKRLKTGVEILKTNDNAWQSFVYMNEAMLLQRIKTKHCSADKVSWYPFQMAYILQIIPDIVNDESDYHNDVDLLWFPTGGGKTEAYLGLSAFSILYRRISGDSNKINGVTVIMRYTLRLLTIQQFERATALVCSLEYLRRKYGIPGNEISIGLWIGSAMTPNHIEDALATLNKIKEDSTAVIFEANPMQITKCPWCGAEIGVSGYSINNSIMNISCCNNHECDFSEHLPIYVVDDNIYDVAPTFILSTVDKFARITWEEEAGNILGANGCYPPSLIIQDELHLISGPLGSITGLYEIAIDEICYHYGKKPKIIASTATVKNAAEQIRILYNRKMIQFPPNGLSYEDSFFAIKAGKQSRPARTYLGICSIGFGSSDTLIKLFALLTFLKYIYKKQGKDADVIDQFYTYVGYFNSLKELGSNAIIISDRINAQIKYLATYKFQHEAQLWNLNIDGKDSDISSYLKYDELTSRNSAKEIKNVLEKLSNKFTSSSCYDYIMASNMLSVGIDIERLGVMCVYGQPKSNSEYIQATSRVGRTNPGIVVTLYNGMRAREKSHYEQFGYYHSTIYKYVESTSVTSYSPRAIEKALHCVMMAIIRHTIPRYNSNESAQLFIRSDDDVSRIKQSILNRINEIEPRILYYAQEWLDYYLDCWDELVRCTKELSFVNYSNEDIALFKSADNNTGTEIPTILNSVRNVENSANIYFTKR